MTFDSTFDPEIALLIVQAQGCAYAVTDSSFVVQRVGGDLALLNYNREQDTACTLTVLAPELIGSEAEVINVLAGKLSRHELHMVNRETADGQIRYVTMINIPFPSQHQPTGILHVVEDVTPAGETEQRLSQHRNELANLNSELEKKRGERNLDGTGNGAIFVKEFAALEFLFLILLKKKVAKEEIMRTTGDHREEHVNGRWINVPVTVPTGDYQLVKSDATLVDVAKCVIQYIGTSSLQPKNWRKIVDALFSSQLPKFAGTIWHDQVYEKHFLKRLSLELSVADVSTMLALKAAIRTSPAILTEDRGIVMGLSGGLFASLIFREKGTLIAKFQEKPLEIFVNQLKSKDRLLTETLYHQAGYAKGVINIEIPAGYYILSSDYVIEIHFNASAILLNQNHMAAFGHDISSKARRDSDDRDDEMRRQQQAAWDWDDD